MKEFKTGQIRNVALVSHNGAGKTTFVERLLFKTGITTRMGSVDSGSTMMDFDEEEIARQGSVTTSIASLEWKDFKLNLFDTPGYADFVGEVNSALAVAEGAVVFVEAVSGVEVGTELVWQNRLDRGLPALLIVSKMDRDNVRTSRVMESISSKLEGTFVKLQLPIGQGASFKGVVDLLTMKAFLGEEDLLSDIPEDLVDEANEARVELIEAAAEGDDEILMKYLEGEELDDAEILTGLKAAIMGGTVPILFSAAHAGIAFEAAVDAIAMLLPAPNEMNEFKAINAAGEDVSYPVSDVSPLAALIFKTREDQYGKQSLVKVYGGTLESDSRVWDANIDSELRVGTISTLVGREQTSVQRLHSGDIGVLVRMGEASTNDTICDQGMKLILPATEQPLPLVSVAVHPVSQSDVAKLSSSLTRLVAEDPTLSWHSEPATRETIVSGMGAAHLDMAVRKAQSKFGLGITTSVPKIPYRETITKSNSAEYTHKKQTGGAGQYARVFLRVESLPDDGEFEFSSEIFGGSLSGPFVTATEKGCRQALATGIIAGYPVTGVKAIVYDGKEHPVDSKEIAFQVAGREALKKAALGAGPVILEPIYEMTVTVPAEYMGDVIGDFNTRRARVLGMDQEGAKSVVHAEVPLAEIQTYSADIRSMTQGRGYYAMKFLRYGRVPAFMQDTLIAARQKELEEERA